MNLRMFEALGSGPLIKSQFANSSSSSHHNSQENYSEVIMIPLRNMK